jgi:succinate dehydrogenase / fumarate reductase flavoprotein subunit
LNRPETLTHQFDVIVIGAGGAGLMAALNASHKARIAVLSKLYPSRSHTGAAQGGVSAALGNLEEDHPEWHAYDTVKGSDYLGDQDAIDFMCSEAVQAVYELEHMGLPFSRNPDGRIAQRPFGGHTNNETGKPVRRAAYAADRTGHMILQTLYQQCIKNGIKFFNEFVVLDLLIEGGSAAGAVAMELASGDYHVFRAPAVIIATGGHGRMWQVTSNAFAYTGDGAALALRSGIPLQDMEFFQFHPTGIYKLGILITEAVRGEGGVLINDQGDRFMQRYAPHVKDLASRDVVSRAEYLEIQAGRGIHGQDYMYLDVRPETVNKYAQVDGRTRPDGTPYQVTEDEILAKLPDIIDFCETYLGINPVKEPVPVQPTAHYAMGGIPTDKYGRVILDDRGTVLPGLYAAGEVACVSVHGANRLGTNSLLDLVVFGKHSGQNAADYALQAGLQTLTTDPLENARGTLEGYKNSSGKESVAQIRKELRKVMSEHVGVFRIEEGLKQAVESIKELRQRYQLVGISDQGSVFNLELLSAWELGNLIDLALVTATSALARQESRGAHSREDYPRRNDDQWLRHTLAWLGDGQVRLGYKPVVLTHYPLQARSY